MKNQIHKNLVELKSEYDAIQAKLLESNIHSNIKEVTKLNKFIKKSEGKIKLFNQWNEHNKDIEDAKEIIASETSKELINDLKKMIDDSSKEIIKIELLLENLMINKDQNDERDAIIQLQGAAGGDEAKIFVGDLFRAYQKYASKMGWTIEMIEEAEADMGGYSNVSFYVRGVDVYGHLKFESGVHRVQRIPSTETQGRVHTSTITASVMPEVEEVDVEINNSDLRVDTYRSGGKGGQHANKTDSAVRITHIPTGIVAQSQDGRSQHHNKDIAMQLIRSRIYEIRMQEEAKEAAGNKKILVGTGDRSEKIRTYNYPQNRITDHRIGLTLKKLDRVMDGGLDEVIDALMRNILES